MWHMLRRSFSLKKPSQEHLETLTYYEILNVRPNSSKAEIRRSYLSLARKHHPDLQLEPSHEFTYINKAYQTLMDDQEKAKYDDSLLNDSDYYQISVGKFSLSIKYLFLMSVGGFLIMLAATEGKEDSEDFCPNSYKMKKVQLSDEQEKLLENVQEVSKDLNFEVAWKKSYIKTTESNIFNINKNKSIYKDKLL